MPWILWRHLSLATLRPFALLLGTLTAALLLLLSLRLGELAPAASFGLGDLLPLFGYSLPHLLLLTVPVTFLAGVLFAHGQISAEGGYVAARAAGIGPMRLAAPALALGVALAAAGLALTLKAEPWSNSRLRREVVRLAKVGAVTGLRPGVFHATLRDLILYAGAKDPSGELREVVLSDRRERDRAATAFARRGRLRADPDRDILFVELEDGELHSRSDNGRTFRRATFGRYHVSLDLRAFLERRVGFLGAFVAEDLDQIRAHIEGIKRFGHSPWYWERALHQKFSLPLGALVFAIFGVALGQGRVRAPRIYAALAALAVVAAYYALLRTGDALAGRLQIPAWLGAWLPNLVLFPAGLTLLWRRTRSVG